MVASSSTSCGDRYGIYLYLPLAAVGLHAVFTHQRVMWNKLIGVDGEDYLLL